MYSNICNNENIVNNKKYFLILIFKMKKAWRLKNMESFNINRGINFLDEIQLSSINQTAKHENLSKRYHFLNTKSVLEDMANSGWFPVQAQQKKVRKEEYEGFQSHTVLLANKNLESPTMTTFPRIMLKNGHDGKSAIHFIIALYEKICANGLCVANNKLEDIRITHVEYKVDLLQQAIGESVKRIGETLDTVESMKQYTLSSSDRTEYAQKAIDMAFDGEKYSIKPEDLLYNWRVAQKEPTLWNTYNTVQERIIRGGVRQIRSDGSRIHSRAITAIDRNIKVNKNLWTLAESYL